MPGEVTDRDALAKAMAGCDIVVNCTYGAREAAKPVNIDAVKVLVEEAARARIGRVIHLSTLSVYGLPPDGELTEDSPEQAPKSHLYGWSKLQGEQVGFAKAKELDVDFRVLQPTVVYGPGAPSWTQNPLRMLKTGRVILVNGGDGICNARLRRRSRARHPLRLRRPRGAGRALPDLGTGAGDLARVLRRVRADARPRVDGQPAAR